MRKIADAQDLQAEISRLLAYSQGQNPSRERLASELRGLADRVTGTGRTARIAPWAASVYPRDFDILEGPASEAYETITNLLVATANLAVAGDLMPGEPRDLQQLGSLLDQAQASMMKVMRQIEKF